MSARFAAEQAAVAVVISVGGLVHAVHLLAAALCPCGGGHRAVTR